jgi:transketolase
MSLHDESTHTACVNTIKGLAMDAVQKANSGHPGMPMGTASLATVLWTSFLKHDPAAPSWPDRDRFVLSAGHGSMLIYSLLHLSGYDVSLDDIKAFRQWDSKTPGHPEYGHTQGIETTTGPLGQGFAMGVGMAIAERFLRESFGADLVDHHTYAIVGDGDLMEGVAYEAASIAGHLGLGRLIYLFDDNEITIDGGTDLSFSEDIQGRFESSGWHVLKVDGHDAQAVHDAIAAARAETNRPSIICCRTVIGQGAATEGTSATHGAPLGADEIRATKQRLGMNPDEHFVVSEAATSAFRAHGGADAHAAWQARLDAHPRRDEFMRWLASGGTELVESIDWPSFEPGSKLATRKASLACLKAVVAAAPQVIGGSADLAGSNGTKIGKPILTADNMGGASTLAFGIREHAMAAVCNGLALHGSVLPYCATFLVFHDYMRPSVRLSCLMKQRVIYIYTHDSVFLGEDGPTHQPVETLLAMRATPNMRVLRPADATETAEAWKAAIARDDGPTALVLTRQGLPILDRSTYGDASGVHQGGYVLATDDTSDVVLVGSGSEVSLCLAARDQLASEGIRARVVSMPSPRLFASQSSEYRAQVLPANVPRLSVEAGVTLGWQAIVGLDGDSIGIDHFGASAPASVLAQKFGFTPDNVAERAKALLR